METATVRIPVEKRNLLKIIAGIENTDIKAILTDLIDEYIERHKETLELLSRPEWVEVIALGKQEVTDGIKGKSLDQLAD